MKPSRMFPDGVYVPRAIRQLPHKDLLALYSQILGDRKRTDAQQRQLEYLQTELLARQEGVHSEPSSRAGQVYVIQSGEHCKIGRTHDVRKRVLALQTGSPHPIRLLTVIATEDAMAVEKGLHRRYAHKRRSGEWFALTPEDIAEITSEFGGAS
jgi:hypothetical protein